MGDGAEVLVRAPCGNRACTGPRSRASNTLPASSMRQHGRDRPIVLALLDLVQAVARAGVEGLGEQRAVAERARADLPAALHPGEDSPARERVRDRRRRRAPCALHLLGIGLGVPARTQARSRRPSRCTGSPVSGCKRVDRRPERRAPSRSGTAARRPTRSARARATACSSRSSARSRPEM